MLTLVQNGRSSYAIVLTNNAIPSERTAANELQSYIQQITGATLPIKGEAEVAADVPQIVVGAGNRAKLLLPQQVWKKLGNDGIVIKTQGNILILSGSRPRGALYAVYQFLEDAAGVRWWTPTENTIPRQSTLKVASRDIVYTPPFGYREHYTSSVQVDTPFATKMKENGHHQHQDESLGGHYNMLGFVHTFHKLLPIGDYFKEHPEWFADPNNGNKPCTKDSAMPEGPATQLNLTNDAMRRELTNNAIRLISQNPNAGIISISQNDNNNYCRSEGDMVLIEREGSPSGALIHFINQVAADIEKEYPDFLVETLAYEYTVKPPKTIKPRHNVIVRICPIGDISRPLDSDDNAEMRKVINGWRAIAPHLYIWDYVTNFAHGMMPHPNLRTIAPNMRYFARSNVFGVFEQGDAYTDGIGDVVDLRAWLTSRLMWNPQLDDSRLIDEFLKGYYGPAAPHLRAYLDRLQNGFLETGRRLGMYNSDFSYLTLDIINKSWADFKAAEKAVAHDPVLSSRIRRSRLALDTAIINRQQFMRREAALTGKPATALPVDMKAFVEDYITTAKSYKARLYSERQTFDAYVEQARSRAIPRAPLPEPLLSQLTPSQIAQDVIDIKDPDFFYTAWTHQEVNDAEASGGKTSRFDGRGLGEQILSYTMQEPNQKGPAQWDVYARVRIESSPGAAVDKPAFSAGIYEPATKKYRLETKIDLGEMADGKYHLIKIGTWPIENGELVWITPVGRADLTFIYVDRMILVRKK